MTTIFMKINESLDKIRIFNCCLKGSEYIFPFMILLFMSKSNSLSLLRQIKPVSVTNIAVICNVKLCLYVIAVTYAPRQGQIRRNMIWNSSKSRTFGFVVMY